MIDLNLNTIWTAKAISVYNYGMHVRAAYPQHLPYEVYDGEGNRIPDVLEADDETGEYVVAYFRAGHILTDQHGRVIVTHRTLPKLVLRPIPTHPNFVTEDEAPYFKFFAHLMFALQSLSGEFKHMTLTPRQLEERLTDVLTLVFDGCSGKSPAGHGFVWLPVVERDGKGEAMAVPPRNMVFPDVSSVWEKFNRLQEPYPQYLERERPPQIYHPENS